MGRDISIGDDVSLLFFLVLKVKFSDVKIGNVLGGKFEFFVKVEKVDVEFFFDVFFSGGVVCVECFVLINFEINLEENVFGGGNWEFESSFDNVVIVEISECEFLGDIFG